MSLKTVLVDGFYSNAKTPAIPRQNVELIVEGILPEVCRLLNAENSRFPRDPQKTQITACPQCGQRLYLMGEGPR